MTYQRCLLYDEIANEALRVTHKHHLPSRFASEVAYWYTQGLCLALFRRLTNASPASTQEAPRKALEAQAQSADALLAGAKMPAKTPKQAKFMKACAHNPESMEQKCPPKSVAREFMHAPKQLKGKRGKGRS